MGPGNRISLSSMMGRVSMPMLKKRRRPKANRQGTQRLATAIKLFPFSALTSEALVGWLWWSDDIWLKDAEEHNAMAHRTRFAMIDLILLGNFCEVCQLRGITQFDNLEGHHPKQKLMYISEYKHCITRKFRRRTLEKLAAELIERIFLICKKCHKELHHT